MFTISAQHYQGYKVHQVDLSTIHLSVYEDITFQPILERDFGQMINPIILVTITHQEYMELYNKHHPQLTLPPEQDQLLITWGGSQRCYLANKLGYKTISSVIIPTIKEAWTLQHQQRKSWTPAKAIKLNQP
jgi:hypothetical protein